MKSFIGSKAIGVNPNTENMQVSMALAAYLAGEDAQKDHYDMRKYQWDPCDRWLDLREYYDLSGNGRNQYTGLCS